MTGIVTLPFLSTAQDSIGRKNTQKAINEKTDVYLGNSSRPPIDPYEVNYAQKKNSASNLMIAGGASMGVGTIAMAIGTAQAVNGGVSLNANEFESGATTGAIGAGLFLVGAGVLAAGIIVNTQANSIKRKHMSLLNQAPPVQLASKPAVQQGITLAWIIGR